MKNIFRISGVILLILSILTVYSCKKGDAPPLTLKAGQFTDIDHNVYNTITIGTQVWMKENLKTTRYNDGTTIPLVTDSASWATLWAPGYCWYNNDTVTYKATYGAQYNWYTVNTGKLCPKGWHVPSDAEWTVLIDYLGGEDVAGGKLKETGTTHWDIPNEGATNESGFTALPGGDRGYLGTYEEIGQSGSWWCSTQNRYNTDFALFRFMHYGLSGVICLNYYLNNACSVRCVKDN